MSHDLGKVGILLRPSAAKAQAVAGAWDTNPHATTGDGVELLGALEQGPEICDGRGVMETSQCFVISVAGLLQSVAGRLTELVERSRNLSPDFLDALFDLGDLGADALDRLRKQPFEGPLSQDQDGK